MSVSDVHTLHSSMDYCLLRMRYVLTTLDPLTSHFNIMPVIKTQRITTFSSEDVNHPAQNLLSSDTYRKWKCASPGEKQAVVVFQVRSI